MAAWTDEQNDACVENCMEMFKLEREGKPYVKKSYNERVQKATERLPIREPDHLLTTHG